MDKFNIQIDLEHIDTLVSILNAVYEQKGGDVDESGFGYTYYPTANECRLFMADGGSFGDGIDYLWNMIKD